MQSPHAALHTAVFASRVPPPPPRSTVSSSSKRVSTPDTSLSTWHPVILKHCGKHTLEVYAVAALLRDNGPQTTQQLTQSFGLTQRDRIDRATTLGREIGLFTRTGVTRNLRLHAVVSTSPSTQPPVYPACAILATENASMRPPNIPKNGKLSPLANTNTYSKTQSDEEREYQKIENQFLDTSRIPEYEVNAKAGASDDELEKWKHSGMAAPTASRIESDEELEAWANAERTAPTAAASSAGTAKPLRLKRPKPAPVPLVPTPEVARAVLELAKLWAAACRTAFNRLKWASALQGETPWNPADKKMYRRWRAYYRLWLMLRTHKIDPAEYCVAITQRHASRPIPWVPNPASMSGNYGRTMYWWWKADLEEKWTGVANAVQREAKASTADVAAQLAILLQHYWRECEKHGTRDRISLTWDPDVIWLFRLREPAAKLVIDELLAQPDSEYAPQMREALQQIEQNPRKQLRLYKTWSRVIGKRPRLREHTLSDADLQRIATARALQEQMDARRAAERLAAHEASMQHTADNIMAGSKRRHMKQRAARRAAS